MGKDANDRLLAGEPLLLEGEPWPASEPEPSSAPSLAWKGKESGWFTSPPPPREWLIRAGSTEQSPGFLPRGEVGILAAPGSSGKTWALVALALAVCSGRPWLGYFSGGRPGRAVILSAEETEHELLRRIQSQATLMGIRLGSLAGRLLVLARGDMPEEGPALVEPSDSFDRSKPGGFSLFGLQVLSELEAEAKVEGWDLVVADPLSAFGPPDCEVDNAAATATMRAIEKFCGLPGNPAVLVAHHTRKGAGKEGQADADDVRGASGLVNRARWVATLSRLPSPWEGVRVSSLQVVKANYSPDVEPLIYLHPHQHNGKPAYGAIREAFADEQARVAEIGADPAILLKRKSAETPPKPAATTKKQSKKPMVIDGPD